MTIYEAAKLYHSLGLSIVPILPGKKHPSIKWKPYQTALPTTEEIDRWFSSNNAHIGLITGPLSGVVAVDADDADAIAWAEENLPPTPVRQRTRRGAHYFYCFVPGVKNQTGAHNLHLDVRGESGIIVLAPSKNYELSGSPEDFKKLPSFPTDLFFKPQERPFLEAELPALGEETNSRLIREVKSLIMRINPDCPRDVWRSVGMALKSLGSNGSGERLFQFWDEWSRSSDIDYPHDKNRYQWDSFQPGAFNIGNLRAAVRDYGDLDGDVGHRLVERLLKSAQPEESLCEEMTFHCIMEKEMPPMKWIVNGFLAEGLTVMAGRAKVGKSFLCLDLVGSVAQGSQMFGTFHCEKRAAVYVSLEDGVRRLKGRMVDMDFPMGIENAFVYTEMPKIGEGGITFLRSLKEKHSDLGLIVIDIMERILPAAKGASRKYEEIYPHLTRLQKLAMELGIAIVLTHHTKKGIEENINDEILGSTGIQGAADELIIVKRKQNETKGVFSLTSRDFGDKLYEVEWDEEKRRWVYLGKGWVESENENDKAICKAIAESLDAQLLPTDIKKITGINTNTVRSRLKIMLDKKKIIKNEEGYYLIRFA